MIWDCAGVKKTIALNSCIAISAFSLLILSPIHKNQYIVLLAFGMCGLSYGGANLMGISFTRTVFGLKHFAENYGFGSSPMVVSSFLGPYVMGEIKLITGSYQNCFVLFAIFGCISLFFLVIMKRTNY